MLAAIDEARRNGAQQLDDVRQVVLVARIILAAVRIEQIVAGGQLEGQTGRRPDVGGEIVRGAEQHLDGTVLPCLDVVGEVVVLWNLENLVRRTKVNEIP